MRLITMTAVGGLSILAGCIMPKAVPPMVAATPGDIAAESASFAALPLSAQTILTTGWSINTARCISYFNALTVRADQNAQTERGLTLLGAAGASGAALAGGPVGAAAAVPIATTLASGLAANQQADLGGAPPAPTFGLVQQARKVFEDNSAIPPSLDAEAAKAYAGRLIEEDATYCQPAGAQSLNSQAILAAQPVVMSPTGSATPAAFDWRGNLVPAPPRIGIAR